MIKQELTLCGLLFFGPEWIYLSYIVFLYKLLYNYIVSKIKFLFKEMFKMENQIVVVNRYGVHRFKSFEAFGRFVKLFPNLKLIDLR